jgi:transcriptional regulator with XRE-family HTH domain
MPKRQRSTPEPTELGELIRTAMTDQQLSLNKLAEAAGVGVATVANLLEQGSEKAQSGVHPLVLRKVAEVLGLDQVLLFQVAGYLVAEEVAQPLSLDATYLAVCFDSLPAEQQRLLIDMAHSLMSSAGIPRRGVRVREVLQQTEALCQQHPIFQNRPLGIRREVGRFLGNLTQTTTQDILLSGIEERIQGALQGDNPPRQIARHQIQAVLQHPDVGVVLNALLPRKEIPTNLEKLYWLVHDSDTAGRRLADLPSRYEPYREAIRDLWKLLEKVSQ